MSYLVLARKWRPLSFDDVVGQEHITRTLEKAIEKDRVAHAYLFTGTRGVGKTTTARILARALNCENGPTPRPCGTCESCRAIIGGSSFDVVEIDGASNNSVDDVRELRENINYTSMGGRYRIIVIDEVHMLTRSAFNALLKTLEEPPERVIFIFATTEPFRIPATIHSRCQRFDFRRIGTEQISKQLDRICTSEKTVCDPGGLALIARKADGSMRDALSLLDQVYSCGRETISEEDVRAILGIVSADVYHAVMEAVVQKNSRPVLDIVQDVLYQGFDLHEFIIGLEEYIRGLLFAGIPDLPASRTAEIPPENSERLREQAEKLSEGSLIRMAEIVRTAERDLRWSAYPRFLIESLLLKLVHMDDTVSLENLLRAVGDNPSGVSGAQRPDNADQKKKSNSPTGIEKKSGIPATSAGTLPGELPDGAGDEIPFPAEESDAATFPQDPPEMSARDLKADWPDFVKYLTEERPHLGSFLSHADPVSFGGTTLDVRFAHQFKFHFNEVTKRANRQIVNEKLAHFAGTAINLHITLENRSAAQDESAGSNSRDRVANNGSIQDDIRNEPIIQSVLDVFDGEVVV